MKKIPLFIENIYEFDFLDHAKHQNNLVSLIKSGQVNNSNQYKINFSRSDLHTIEDFKPLSEFMSQCIRNVMYDLGYVPDIRITSMWSTFQKQNESHHYHTHCNTFLAAVYYLHCSNTDKAKGTVFYNTNYPKYSPIMPNAHKKFPKQIKLQHRLDFVPSKVYVFPACIPHMTALNQDEERIVIGMNSMPVGLANDDEFDKYEYN